MMTRNIAAYAAWIMALVAILMPPAMAEAGLATLADAQVAIYSMLDEPASPALAHLVGGGRYETARRV